MRKTLLGGLTAVLVLLSASSVSEISGKLMPRAEVKKLAKIAEELSRYDLPWGALPTVMLVSDEWIDMNMCDGDPTTPCPVQGYFDPQNPDFIYLKDSMTVKLREVVLVHETVHWMQERLGNKIMNSRTCPARAAREAEAYAASYLYEVLYQGTTEGFWMPDYSNCMPSRWRTRLPPTTTTVIGPPVITKGSSP